MRDETYLQIWFDKRFDARAVMHKVHCGIKVPDPRNAWTYMSKLPPSSNNFSEIEGFLNIKLDFFKLFSIIEIMLDNFSRFENESGTREPAIRWISRHSRTLCHQNCHEKNHYTFRCPTFSSYLVINDNLFKRLYDSIGDKGNLEIKT